MTDWCELATDDQLFEKMMLKSKMLIVFPVDWPQLEEERSLMLDFPTSTSILKRS
jgi:hypothetical protein